MLAYFWGEDAYGIDRAVETLARELAGADGGPPTETWRVSGAEVDLATLAERLATQPLFGGGLLVVVRDPGPLARSAEQRAALEVTLASIAPGNGLALVELVDASARPGASLDALREAVDRAGGEVRQFRAPTRERMEALVETRARELGLELERGAARLLAQRVGAFVREGDVDRRRQGQLASAELEKLAVYRPDGRVNLDDVRALVPEAVPGTTWGFLDAIGSRRSGEAMTLLDRLLTDGTAPTALVFQLHRRLRELLAAREHLAAGATAASLVRAMKLKPFRAEKLAEQARAWSAEELERALDGLFAVDVAIKGLDGAGTSEAAKQLTFELWLIERVARASQR